MPTIPPLLPIMIVPAQTTIHWEGSIADIIPDDNIVIIGKDSNVNIAKGDLNLETNGTFDSKDLDNALVIDQSISNVGSMSLKVINEEPLAPTDIFDKTATANVDVDVTMTAAFPT
jgi:hypothetical protein